MASDLRQYRTDEVLNKVLNTSNDSLKVDIVAGAEYAEDSGHTSADTGNFVLGVRNDTLAALGGTDGDYVPFQMNSSGALFIDIADGGQLDTIIDTLETTLTAIETDQAAIEVLLTGIDADTNAIKTAVQIIDDWDDSNYANVNANIAGTDIVGGAGSVASGVQRGTLASDDPAVVDLAAIEVLLTAANVDHAANEVLLGTIDADTNAIKGHVDGIETLITSTNSKIDTFDAVLDNILTKNTEIDAVLDTIKTDTQEIEEAVETIEGAVSGSEMQVDVVASLPAGSAAIGKLAANSGVDIGDVDVTSIIPGTGATNLGKAEDAAHSSGDTGVMPLAVRNDDIAALGGADGDYAPLQVNAAGALYTNDASGEAGSILVTGTSAIAAGISGTKFIAIQFLEDTVFASSGGLVASSEQLYPDDAGVGSDISSNGAPIDGVTFPQGMTIFGRWDGFTLASGACIGYIGYV